MNVAGFDPMQNLHAVWDIALVRKLMAQDGPGMLAGMESRFRGKTAAVAGLRQHREDRRRVLQAGQIAGIRQGAPAPSGDSQVH